MSEPNPHMDANHTTAQSTFTEAQWAYLRSEDYSAGRAVVVLMLGIFSIGVLLYGVVAFSVWSHSGFSVFN